MQKLLFPKCHVIGRAVFSWWKNNVERKGRYTRPLDYQRNEVAIKHVFWSWTCTQNWERIRSGWRIEDKMAPITACVCLRNHRNHDTVANQYIIHVLINFDKISLFFTSSNTWLKKAFVLSDHLKIRQHHSLRLNSTH